MECGPGSYTDLCAGLLDDLPDGSEISKLQDLEEHVHAQSTNVKKLKNQNAKVCLALLLLLC